VLATRTGKRCCAPGNLVAQLRAALSGARFCPRGAAKRRATRRTNVTGRPGDQEGLDADSGEVGSSLRLARGAERVRDDTHGGAAALGHELLRHEHRERQWRESGRLEGADAHCAALARAAGSTRTSWRAYLSTTAPGGDAGVNARDRIGKGPWRNAKGVVVARSVQELHSDTNNLTKQTALTERDEIVSGRGDAVNLHDILTGSDPQGLYSTAGGDTTCRNWTSGDEGSAIVGHHDRVGLKDTRHMKSWNSSHGTRGCSQDALKSTGGAGLFYCFAAD